MQYAIRFVKKQLGMQFTWQNFYNKAERSKQSTINGNEKRIQGIDLAQVVAYIEETRVTTKGIALAIFRLAEHVC